MKANIIKQSILLFAQKGFGQTSIQDIVDSLGVTKGTFYYYFSSKEELLNDIHITYIQNLLERQNHILSNTVKTYKEKLSDIVGILITDIKENGPSARVYFRELMHLNEDNVKEIKEKRDQFRANIENVLKQGVDTGEFRKQLRVDIVTFGILGIANWSYTWYNPEKELNEQELAQIFVDMILNGIEV